MGIIETHRHLLNRLLPEDKECGLSSLQGQFHHVVIGSEEVVCFARSEAASERLPARAAVLRTLAGLDLGFLTPRPLAQGGIPGTDEPPYLPSASSAGRMNADDEQARQGVRTRPRPSQPPARCRKTYAALWARRRTDCCST